MPTPKRGAGDAAKKLGKVTRGKPATSETATRRRRSPRNTGLATSGQPIDGAGTELTSSQPPANGDLRSAVASGDRRLALEALRDELAVAVAESSSNGGKAQLTAQLRAVLKDLADLGSGRETSPLDELRSRRERRIATTDAAAPPG